MTLREIIYKRDGGQCVYCGKSLPIEGMHLEHKIPRVFGGTSDESNLLCSCSSCNLEKSSKLVLKTTDLMSVVEAEKLSKELRVILAALDVILNYHNNSPEAALKASENLKDILS